jgi:cell wall-associated NlpC family hydrolase
VLGKLAAVVATMLISLPLGFAAIAGAQGAATSCDPSTPAGMLSDLDAEQTRDARWIVAVGQQRGAPDNGLVVGLMAAMQESGLRNLPYGDRDSLGLFQQRPSKGWGTPEQILDPAYAAAAFFGGPTSPDGNPGLLDVAGWEQLAPGRAAQAVQQSAYPDSYARWEESAQAWLAEIASQPGLGASQCPVAAASGNAAVVVSSAARWLGTPYAWGGGDVHGPTEGFAQGAGTVGFDCSGLTLYAYAQVGITLPRTTGEQWLVPGVRLESFAELQPGDLVFFATDTGDPATIHHVAISLGDDAMLEAPRTGDVVRITRGISENAYWAPQFIGGLRILR